MPGMLLALALAGAATPPAQVHDYRGVMISPKGDRIVAIESDELFQSEAEPHPVVVVRSRADGAILAKYDPCPTCFYSGAAWSPDGQALVFVSSDRKTRSATLQVVRDGKATVALDFAGLLETPRWSPDGRTLAVLATDRPRKIGGATQAGAPIVGEIGAATDEQRIAVLPATGGPLKFLSPADTYVYEYDWAPDGKAFAATAAKGDGDNNWWVAKLVAVGLDGSFRQIADPGVQMKWPKVAPDGRTVTFIGGLHSDFGPTGGDLYVAPFAGGKAVDVTPEGQVLTLGKPRKLFEKPFAEPVNAINYDAYPDGSRFVVLTTTAEKATTEPRTHLTMVFNLFDEIRRIAGKN